MASGVVLFIDANQYLKLYGMVLTGKDVLDWLEEQQAHIFVSAQIVDEVFRNKLSCAQKFFADKPWRQPSDIGQYLPPLGQQRALSDGPARRPSELVLNSLKHRGDLRFLCLKRLYDQRPSRK
jgi:hypothetical protein